MLDELPQALSKSVLSYLSVHSSDHLSVARSCRGLLNDVEAFSETELNRISVEHAVDDDWLSRVVATARQATPAITERLKLRIAHRIHLYSLVVDPLERWSSSAVDYSDFSVNQDGNKLVTFGGIGSNGHLDLWDLQGRQHIRSFNISSQVQDCVFWGNHIVSHSIDEGIIRVWGLDGSCKIFHEIEEFAFTNLETSSSTEVMWMNEENVNALDLLTGARRRTRHNVNVGERPSLYCSSYLCKDRLIAVVIEDDEIEIEDVPPVEQPTAPGIYVIKPLTLGVISRTAGYSDLITSHDGHVVAWKEDGDFDVLRLEGDHLVYHRSIEDNDYCAILVWNSRLYLQTVAHVKVFNIFSGALERKLHCNMANRSARDENLFMVPVCTRKELLYGFHGGKIMAFLQEE